MGTFLDIDHLADTLSKLSTTLGVRLWDLGAGCSEDSSVQVDRGEPRQLKVSQRSSLTLRVWNADGLVGVTNTSDLSTDGLQRALQSARDASAFGNPDDAPAFSPLCQAPLPHLDQPMAEPVGIRALLETLKNSEATLLQRHPAIDTVPYNGVGQSRSERLYLNCEGARRHQHATTASIYLYARAEEPGRKPRSAGAVRLAYGADDLDIVGCIEEAAERTISHLDYQVIDTDRYLVCFSPEAFLDLLGAFNSLFNARSILDGVSLSRRDSLGQPLAVPFLTIRDNGLHPAHVGASAFDGEGTPTSPLTLVEQGVLTHLLHSEATARRFGVQPTGHAGLGAKVSVGSDWMEVLPASDEQCGDRSVSRSTGSTFVWIDSLSALHAGVQASQGSFSLPFNGWLVRNGERRSIEAATVAGDIRTVLNTIVALEGEPEILPGGRSPHVWVEGLSITGEA